jgi:hypothetical protein
MPRDLESVLRKKRMTVTLAFATVWSRLVSADKKSNFQLSSF